MTFWHLVRNKYNIEGTKKINYMDKLKEGLYVWMGAFSDKENKYRCKL